MEYTKPNAADKCDAFDVLTHMAKTDAKDLPEFLAIAKTNGFDINDQAALAEYMADASALIQQADKALISSGKVSSETINYIIKGK